jgi:hypothetical protein
MGKTSLALLVMHNQDITKHYANRYFVRCDAVTTRSQLLVEMADVLSIRSEGRDETLLNTVLSQLNASPTLLCLDNFETPWEAPDSSKVFPEFLGYLDSLSNLAILLTIRGIQRPNGLKWTAPFLPPLAPLPQTDRHAIFADITQSQEVDDYSSRLLQEVGDIPLAIILLARLVRDNLETTEGLWERWEQERTSIVEQVGERDKTTSLDFSIETCIRSLRMTSCPPAVDVLSMIVHLPRGLPEHSHLRKTFITKISTYGKAVQTLKWVSGFRCASGNLMRMRSAACCAAHHFYLEAANNG